MKPEPLTLYELLGCPPDADQEQINFAYRLAAKKYHPDAGGDADTMAAINAAYEILKDPDRRAHYDATGSTESQPEDAMRAAAYGMIATEVFKITNLEQSILRTNLIDYLVLQFEKQREGGMEAIARNTATIAKLQKLLGRMKPRDPAAPNMIERMVKEKIAGVEKLNVGNQASIDLLDLSIAVLHEYQDTPEGGGFYPYKPAATLLTKQFASTGPAAPPG